MRFLAAAAVTIIFLLSFGILAAAYAREVIADPDITAQKGNIISCGIHIRILDDDFEYFEGTISTVLPREENKGIITIFYLTSGTVDRVTHKLDKNKPKNPYFQSGELDSRGHIKEFESKDYETYKPDEFVGTISQSDKTVGLWLFSILESGMTVGYDSPVEDRRDIIFNLARSEIPQEVNSEIAECVGRMLKQYKAATEK